MRCKICKNEFNPSKYRPNQQICSQPACQRQRQIENERTWREKNPDYFKYLGQNSAWQDVRRNYNKLWRQTHKKDLKSYEKTHKEERREYMRQYMRKYRSHNAGL